MAIGTPLNLGHANGGTGGTIVTVNAINSGDMVFVLHGGSSAANTMNSLTDTAGNIYNLAWRNNTSGTNEIFWSGPALPMAASNSIVAVYNGTANNNGLLAFTVTGMTVPPTDVIGTFANGTGTSATAINSGTLGQAVELLIGFLSINTNPGVLTLGGSFTALTGTTAAQFILPCYQIVSSTGSVSWAPSWVNSTSWKSNIVTFKAALGGILVGPAPTHIEDEQMGHPGVGGGSMGAP